MEQRPQTRKTNDNGRNGDPISLYPLTPEEALEGLLAVKPPQKDAREGSGVVRPTKKAENEH